MGQGIGVHISKCPLRLVNEVPASTETPLLLQLVFLSVLIIYNFRMLIFSKCCKQLNLTDFWTVYITSASPTIDKHQPTSTVFILTPLIAVSLLKPLETAWEAPLWCCFPKVCMHTASMDFYVRPKGGSQQVLLCVCIPWKMQCQGKENLRSFRLILASLPVVTLERTI